MSLAVTDSATMLRRNLLHMRRYPSLTVMLMGQPILFLLLFVFVFGNTLGAGIAGAGGGRAEYLTYITPAIIAMAVASVALGTAVSVAMDMTQGIVARFRTMPIARVSVLAGHVGGALAQTVLAVAVSIGAALALGYRPDAGVADWLGVVGIVLLLALAMTWLTVAWVCWPTVSRPRATPRCPWCCCRSSAAASSRRTRCRRGCAGSRSTSRSHR